jgi:hypothetical protein
MMSKAVDSQAPSGSSTPTGSAPAAPSGSSTERPDVAFNQQLREGPTPAGGAYSIASYFDESGSPVVKADASNVEIVEYDDDGSAISHTSGTISKR